jgi:hypothetical protein
VGRDLIESFSRLSPQNKPENRGVGAEGPAPLFSGILSIFREVLKIEME